MESPFYKGHTKLPIRPRIQLSLLNHLSQPFAPWHPDTKIVVQVLLFLGASNLEMLRQFPLNKLGL